MKNISNLAILFLKGCVLGLSMALPGLSGGTMAFIMGIYEKLIGEISKFKFQHIKKLFSFLTFKKQAVKQSLLFFWTSWDWTFLIPLVFGSLFSGILFVFLAPFLIEKYSLQFYSLVCGLVLASLWKPFQEMKKNGKNLSIFFISFLANLMFFIFGESFSLSPGSEYLSFPIFLPVGFLVSLALIVPGLSGSYLLVLFDLYEKTLLALKEGDMPIIICFLLGVLIGIFSTAKLIRKMLKNHFDKSMAVILGLILSSLYAIYPLPKESLEDIFSFDAQTKVFWLFFASSFILFMVFNLLYEKKKVAHQVP